MRHHYLKTTRVALLAVKSGSKTFEARKNDRLYQPGDLVTLEMVPEAAGDHVRTYGLCDDGTIAGDHADGAPETFRIGFVLCGPAFGVEAGHCVFSLLPRNIDAGRG